MREEEEARGNNLQMWLVKGQTSDIPGNPHVHIKVKKLSSVVLKHLTKPIAFAEHFNYY